MQNRVISPRITSLYGSQPSSVVFVCKGASFGPELQVSIGPTTHLSFCARKVSWLTPELQVSMGPIHHLSFCACNTAWLAPELLVSMGHSPHLWLLHAKQRLLDHNNESLRHPDMSCRFVHAKQRLLGHELQFCMGPRPYLSICACKTAWLATRITSHQWSKPSSVVFACKRVTFGLE